MHHLLLHLWHWLWVGLYLGLGLRGHLYLYFLILGYSHAQHAARNQGEEGDRERAIHTKEMSQKDVLWSQALEDRETKREKRLQ